MRTRCAHISGAETSMLIKGAPPIAADPGGFPDFRIFRFFKKCRFGEFSGGIWGLGGSAMDIGSVSGIQMDGFSAREVPYSFIFNDFHDLGHFGVVFDGLTLLQVGPWTS